MKRKKLLRKRILVLALSAAMLFAQMDTYAVLAAEPEGLGGGITEYNESQPVLTADWETEGLATEKLETETETELRTESETEATSETESSTESDSGENGKAGDSGLSDAPVEGTDSTDDVDAGTKEGIDTEDSNDVEVSGPDNETEEIEETESPSEIPVEEDPENDMAEILMDTEYVSGDFEYKPDADNNATITSYKGNDSTLSIPETLDGYTVVEIGASVFKGNTMLTEVMISDTVTTISNYAFSVCTNLKKVDMPDTVTSIGNSAFSGCTNLSQIELPKGLISTGWTAFENCTSLTSVEIPKSLKNVSSAYGGLFKGCTNLKEVTFEEGITSIPENVFYGCTSIEEIEIPETVTTISEYAFYNCTNLTKVDIPDCVTSIGNAAFRDCTNLSQIELPKGLISTGWNAFENCTSITSVEIPKSLKSVSSGYGGLFKGCTNLKEITFEEGITSIPANLFYGCTSIEEIEIPETVTTISEYAFYNCTNLTKVDIPDCVTSIDNAAFRGCTNLSQIELPKGLISTGWNAFENCTSITSVEIPKSLKSVSYGYGGLFKGCTNLKEVTFEEGITSIPANLFYGCPGIEEIEIPNTISSIPQQAFYECTNLKKVSVPNTITSIGQSAFRGCESLTDIEIPDSVTSIDSHVFDGCTSLINIAIPDSLTEIPNYAFCNCTSLSSIELPDTIKTVGTYAFANCTSLSDITLSDNLNSISNYCLQNSGITSIYVPQSVTSIGNYAFQNCAELEQVIITDGTKTIGDYAFQDCSLLTEVALTDSLTSIGRYAFNNCDALITITIPDSVTEIGSYIFAGSELLSDVKLGTGITTIPEYAFNLCPSLKNIVLPYRVAKINANAFTNCTAFTEVTIPRATTTIADNVFSYPDKLTIYGITGTYAETYAKTIGAVFVNREINATEVSFNVNEIKLNKGATASMILSIAPSDFTDEVVWKVADTSIITVTDTGVITARELGTTTVKVTVGDLSASCTVTVTQPVTSINLDKTSLTLEALDTYALTATVSPDTAENKAINWSSSDETIASVDETGVVTALSKGTAVITAAALDGINVTRKCNVTVTNNGYVCENVSELESEHNYPVNCTDFWLYSREGAEKLYVTFDEKTEMEENFDYIYLFDAAGNQIGKYTGKALAGQTIEVAGDTVKIKLESDDSGTAWGFKVTSISDSGNITVPQPVTSISLNKTSLSLEAFESDTLTAEVLPSTADNKSVIWSSSDEKIASVDENGLVTAHAKGNATIRVEAQDGSGVYNECSVTVVNNGYICSNADELESEHNYPVNSSDFWIYTKEGAEKLYVTFDDHTDIEADVDYLYIYDAAGNQIGKYTGKALAGKTIEVSGNTFKIKLESNDSGTAWGFKVTSVTTTGGDKPGDDPEDNPGGEDNTEGLKIKFVGESVDKDGNCSRIYTGSALTPEIEVTNNGKKLKEGIDYTVKFSNNIKAAKSTDRTAPKVIVSGKGNYSGSTYAAFTIEPKDIGNRDHAESGVVIGGLDGTDTIVVASDTKINPVLVYNGIKLGAKDYELNKPGAKFTAETADKTIKISGKGNYTGEVTLNVKVKDKNELTKFAVSIDATAKLTYNGNIQPPKIKVVTSDSEKKDITNVQGAYYISYGGDRTSAGTQKFTVIGLGSYDGAVSKSYKIQPVKTNNIVKELKNTSYEYVSTGVKFAKGDLKVTDKTLNKELVEGTDYKLTYSGNNKVGTAKYKITFIGNYKGSKAITDGTFSIKQAALKDNDNAVRVEIPDKVCKAGANCKSAPYVTINGVTVKASEYTVTYSTDNKATYSASPKADFTKGDAATVYVKIKVNDNKNYTGELTGEYTVWNKNTTGKNDISKAKVTFYALDEKGNITNTKMTKTPYTGGPVELKPAQIKLTIGNAEVPESAYNYKIINNINKGKAVVIIKAADNSAYIGGKTATFSITVKKLNN